MAILFRILFTLGLLLINGSFLSANVVVNKDGPETPLKFLSENPGYVLGNIYKVPTYLDCHVSVKPNESLERDLSSSNFYPDTKYLDIEDDDADDQGIKYSPDVIKKHYDEQLRKNFKENRKAATNTIPVSPIVSKKDEDYVDDTSDEDTTKAFERLRLRSRRSHSESDEVDTEIPPKTISQMYKTQFEKYSRKNRTLNGSNVGLENFRGDEFSDEDKTHKYTSQEVRSHYKLQKNNNRKLTSKHKKSAKKSRAKRSINAYELIYEWYKNDEKIIGLGTYDSTNQQSNGYTLFQNGTLRFQTTNQTTGEYRCKVKLVPESQKYELGYIISKRTVVEEPSLNIDANVKKNISITEGESIVVPCPISSLPKANVTWFFDNQELNFDAVNRQQKDMRHFLLSNGSLLIVNSRISDSGKYRFNATNKFAKKLYRSSFSVLNVVSRSDDNYNHGNSLLPKLQNQIQDIKSGQNLILHCASHKNQIMWAFTPRMSNIPISLTDFSNELKYVNVSVTKHDGIYNCSTKSDFQIFDVRIVTKPSFVASLKSITTSVAATVKINVTILGNPPPQIEWYKNGELINSTYVRHYQDSILRFESIDPEDEGIYQCFARNGFEEISSSFYLHIRPSIMIDRPPMNARCYPKDDHSMLVTFDRQDFFNPIVYYIATDNPYEWNPAVPSSDSIKRNSFVIKFSSSMYKPFVPFLIFMRNMKTGKEKMDTSQLSKPIQCAMQGVEPQFVKPNSSGIFLRWDIPQTKYPVTSFTIQFRNNSTSNQVFFTDTIVGVSKHWTSGYISWESVASSMQTISVVNRNKTDWDNANITEVKVPGNVSGIYIPNTDEIHVRILGSVSKDGELFEQDHQYLSWKTLKSSTHNLVPIEHGEIQSRGVEIKYNGLDAFNCAEICSNLKIEFITRDSRENFKCDKIDLSANSHFMSKLKPTSSYSIYVRDCQGNQISTEIIVETMQDVPGAVSQSHILMDNGIVLYWNPPTNPNGEIAMYSLEWSLKNETYKTNVTQSPFRFHNTSNSDRFNITIRAIGSTGSIGIPIYINPDKWDKLPLSVIGSRAKPSLNVFDAYMVFAIALISVTCLASVSAFVLCRRKHHCKNSNGIINNEQSPTISPMSMIDNIAPEEMYEMQTLIPNALVMGNGTDCVSKSNPANGGVINSENQQILRTSTPTEDSGHPISIELPSIKCDTVLTLQIDEQKPNGFLKTFHSKSPTEQKEIKNGSMKVNGNLSPYKSFQPSANDQNTSSPSSSFDNSHHQLIDTNLCIGLNNNNDRSKIGKSSSIETDNDEDSEENLHEYDLNDSNLSTKPLHPINWNFLRRPLVGPNG